MIEDEFYPLKTSLKQHIEKYWKKILETPNDQNPATDPDGSRQDVTTNPVYLACSMIGTVTRNIPDISGDKSIFVPVNPVEICERELDPGENESDLIKHAEEDENSATKVTLTIDGKEYNLEDKRHRFAHVGPFDVVIPDKPLDWLEPPGKCKAVADGYYVIINPLAPGPHTVRFEARVDRPHKEAKAWEQDVTYKFNVT